MMRTVPRRRPLLTAVLALALLAACESDQDPGLDPGLVDGPAPSSDTLPDCPPGGPDATTPAAGCLDEGGAVRRP